MRNNRKTSQFRKLAEAFKSAEWAFAAEARDALSAYYAEVDDDGSEDCAVHRLRNTLTTAIEFCIGVAFALDKDGPVAGSFDHLWVDARKCFDEAENFVWTPSLRGYQLLENEDARIAVLTQSAIKECSAALMSVAGIAGARDAVRATTRVEIAMRATHRAYRENYGVYTTYRSMP